MLFQLTQNGILSHKRAGELANPHKDISNGDVQDRRANKVIERANKTRKPLSLHRFSPLFQNPHNVMTYGSDKTSICIIRIHKEVRAAVSLNRVVGNQ